MKRLTLFIIMTLFTAAIAQEEPKIAVYVTGDAPDGNKRVFGARLLTAIAGTWRYSAIERPGEFFAEAERLRTEEYGGAISDAQISELGRRHGIGYVCAAELTHANGAYSITARVIDAKTAATLFAGAAESPLQTAEELASVLKIMVENMFSEQAEVAKKDPPPPPAPAPAAAPADTQEQPPIAVYVTGSVPEEQKKVLGTRILAALVKSGKYRGIERSESFLAKIDEEHVKQRSGAIDDNQISELGKQFGVRFICVADITPAFKDYQVSARIINVETAEVAHIGEAFSALRTAKELQNASDNVVANMFGINLKRKKWMSAGVGFSGGLESGGGLLWTAEPKARIAMPGTAYGAYAFFDATYGQATLGFSLAGGKWESGNVAGELPEMSRTSLSIGVYGKYPFAIGSSERLALFPLAGIEYELSLSGKIENADKSTYTFDGENARPKSGDLSAMWVKAGGGIDVGLNGNIYLRAEALYGFRPANTFETDMARLEKNDGANAEAKAGTGIFFKIGAGYRF